MADQDATTGRLRPIESGEWRDAPGVADYVAYLVDDVLIERAIWDSAALAASTAPAGRAGRSVQGAGFIWYRFWVWRDDQVVERYYNQAGALLGTLIDLCTPFVVDEHGWRTHDLLLDIWIAPDGQVTLGNEAAFELAIADGSLPAEQAVAAERHVRRLTRAIAQQRFPPAMERNWQVDMQRIRATLASRDERSEEVGQ
jgi:predicted RNA-binding protein associated with RNAse of E/G family